MFQLSSLGDLLVSVSYAPCHFLVSSLSLLCPFLICPLSLLPYLFSSPSAYLPSFQVGHPRLSPAQCLRDRCTILLSARTSPIPGLLSLPIGGRFGYFAAYFASAPGPSYLISVYAKGPPSACLPPAFRPRLPAGPGGMGAGPNPDCANFPCSAALPPNFTVPSLLRSRLLIFRHSAHPPRLLALPIPPPGSPAPPLPTRPR